MSRWDVEEIEKLIELLSAHTCIWNPYDPDYTYTKSRNAAFESIAQTMKIPRELVKTKYTNLRAQFFRILRNPAQRDSPKRWIHFDALKFLDCGLFDQSSEIVTANKTADEEEDGMQADELIGKGLKFDNNNEDLIAERLYDDMTEAARFSFSEIKRPPSGTTDFNTHNPHSHKKKSTTIFMKASPREKDIYSIFGDHVANELRLLKHQKHLQQTLKCEILKAIYDVNKSLLT